MYSPAASALSCGSVYWMHSSRPGHVGNQFLQLGVRRAGNPTPPPDGLPSTLSLRSPTAYARAHPFDTGFFSAVGSTSDRSADMPLRAYHNERRRGAAVAAAPPARGSVRPSDGLDSEAPARAQGECAPRLCVARCWPPCGGRSARLRVAADQRHATDRALTVLYQYRTVHWTVAGSTVE